MNSVLRSAVRQRVYSGLVILQGHLLSYSSRHGNRMANCSRIHAYTYYCAWHVCMTRFTPPSRYNRLWLYVSSTGMSYFDAVKRYVQFRANDRFAVLFLYIYNIVKRTITGVPHCIIVSYQSCSTITTWLLLTALRFHAPSSNSESFKSKTISVMTYFKTSEMKLLRAR